MDSIFRWLVALDCCTSLLSGAFLALPAKQSDFKTGIYWERRGVSATGWKRLTYRRYDKSCQEYAIKQLGELGADAKEAVPELIRIFNEQDDFDSGVYNCRSAVARTLGILRSIDSIDPQLLSALASHSDLTDARK